MMDGTSLACLAAGADIMFGYPLPPNEVWHYWTRLAPNMIGFLRQRIDYLLVLQPVAQ